MGEAGNQNYVKEFLIFACIALDVLPIQASSVSCEQLFSAGKETATDWCARLSTEHFEQLQVLKFAWHIHTEDLAAINECTEEIVELEAYKDLLIQDCYKADLDCEFVTDTQSDVFDMYDLTELMTIQTDVAHLPTYCPLYVFIVYIHDFVQCCCDYSIVFFNKKLALTSFFTVQTSLGLNWLKLVQNCG